MKKLTKKLFILFIVFSVICSVCTISRAENEIINVDTNLIQPRTTEGDADDPYGINPISIDGEATIDDGMQIDENIDNIADESEVQKNYFACTSEDIVLENIVYGDAFIFTTGKATINGIVAGNLFVFARDVEISESAQISASVFSFSNTFTLNGFINQNAYVAANDEFTMGTNADIFLDLFLASSKVNLDGCVERNANISCDELLVADTAQILENLSYSSKEEATIPEGVVTGMTTFEKRTYTEENTSSTTTTVLEIVSYIIIKL